MAENKKHILDRFEEHLHENFSSYCERHCIEKNEEHLITFLIDQELIPGTQIQRYTVVNEFEKIKPKEPQHKTQIVNRLADRFCISERTVWSILKNTKPSEKKQTRF